MFLTTLQQLLLQFFPNAKFWVNNSSLYFEDSAFVGHVKITEFYKYAFIDQIYIVTSQQKRGIGTNVLNALITACKQHAFISIDCRPTQGGVLCGVQFCRASGFTQKGNTGIWTKVI